MKKVLISILATMLIVMSIAACGKPEGGVQGTGTGSASYGGKSTESVAVKETWYPTMTGNVAFMDTNLYMVVTKNPKKVQLNEDGSVTALESGQVEIEFYKGDSLDKKVTLMITGY